MTTGRVRLRGVLPAAALAAAAVAAGRIALFRPFPVSGSGPEDGYARAAAVVHVHTTLSDGGGTPEEVIAAARAAGVAVLGITDHNNVDAQPFEGYRDGVLVLVGSELSTPAGHLLGVGLERDPAFRFAGDVRDGLDDIRHLGGVAFASHPLSPRADLRFRELELPGDFGIELLNGDSDARRAGPRLLLTAASYRLNPSWALLTALPAIDETLARWDALLAERDTIGIAGADAHSRLAITRKLALPFPSYEALFRQARNQLLLRRPLTGDAASDRAAVLEALRAGRFYVGLDALAPADGFWFTVEGSAGRVTMGEHLAPSDRMRARAGGRVPAGARLVLKRDGRVVGESPPPLDLPLPGPGVYRVEARLPGWRVPWVVTNPVYVFGAEALEARGRRAEPPARAQPSETKPLAFQSPWSAEHDPVSRMDGAGLTVLEGPGGSDALRLPFLLAPPNAAQPFTWCALVNREERDLSGWRGLQLRLRADGEYRLWIQVRDVNPASTDEGLEWWMASARTAAEWEEVQLSWDRFRTLNPRSDGRLDLDQVRALVFVLDHATVKPGTKGLIEMTDLAVYR